MKLSNFRKARIGDKVWDLRKRKWGEIIDINPNNIYPITVKYNEQLSVCYNFYGQEFNAAEMSDLYWDEIKFEVPEMPKRMIKLKKWIGVYKYSNEEITYSTSHFMYETEEDAKRYCAGTDKHIPIEFEVEE